MALLLKTSHKWLLAGAAIAVPAAVWLLRTYDPNVAGNPFPPCMFHAFTGYFCIGCGLTRALHALVHGDVLRALALNPLGLIVLGLIPVMGAWSAGWQPRGLQPLMRWVLEPKLWLFLLPSYWVARNLPWFPFTLLAPV